MIQVCWKERIKKKIAEVKKKKELQEKNAQATLEKYGYGQSIESLSISDDKLLYAKVFESKTAKFLKNQQSNTGSQNKVHNKPTSKKNQILNKSSTTKPVNLRTKTFEEPPPNEKESHSDEHMSFNLVDALSINDSTVKLSSTSPHEEPPTTDFNVDNNNPGNIENTQQSKNKDEEEDFLYHPHQ